MNRLLTFALLTLISGLSLDAQTIDSFTDPRDGQFYKTVTYEINHSKDSISKVTWLAENLKYKTQDSFCFNDNPQNCDKYGRYYTWDAAMTACPQGWRVPSDSDWAQLVGLYGGMKKAGRHLKSKDALWPKGKGTNKSGFSGLAFGASDAGKHFQFGYAAFFWSSTLSKEDLGEAYDWSFVTNSTEVRHWGGYKLIENCVRCVKEEE